MITSQKYLRESAERVSIHYRNGQVFNNLINIIDKCLFARQLLYLNQIRTQAMPTTLDKIQHHQRILITGNRSVDILNCCRKVLDYYKRPYDLATSQETKIGTGPIILIESSNNLNSYQPHIALIDEVTQDTKDDYMKLADGLPKSGTLVFNQSNKLAKDISDIGRTDVHLEPFQTGVSEAAKALLKRIGISEESFKTAIN